MLVLTSSAKIRRGYFVESDRKYVGAKHVERGDPLRPGLVPPEPEETDHSGVSERVQLSRQGSAEFVGRTTKGETTDGGRAAARRSSAVRADSGRAASLPEWFEPR